MLVDTGISYTRIEPIIKWPGGKRWLVKRFPGLFHIETESRYFEPFLGGAAAFVFYRPKNAHLSDINDELIRVYLAIKDDPDQVASMLFAHQKKHCKEYYYFIRNQNPSDMFETAARFMYLNRTCFNGIYRVNRHGQFNVPMGSRTELGITTDDIQEWSHLFQTATISSCDFEEAIRKTVCGDFIFADPPYVINHNANGFLKYNEALFSWADQKRLASVLCDAAERGVRIVVTNANHQSVSELYPDIFCRATIMRNSLVAGSASNRGKTEELILWTKGALNEHVLRQGGVSG